MTQAPPASSADTGVEPVGDRQELSRIAYGFMASKALFAALEIGLFTRLADGPRTVAELAARTGVVPPTGCAPCCTRSPASGWSCCGGGGYANAPAAPAPPRPRRARRHRRVLPAAGRPADLPRAAAPRRRARRHRRRVRHARRGCWPIPTRRARSPTRSTPARSVPARKLAGRLPLDGARTPARRRRRQRGVLDRVLRAQPGPAGHVLDFPAVVDVARGYLDAAGPGRPHRRCSPATRRMIRWPADQDVVLMSYLLSALAEDEIDAVLAAAHAQPATGRAAGRARLHARRRRAGTRRGGAVVPAVPGLSARRRVVHRRRARAAAARGRASAGPGAEVLIPEITKVVAGPEGDMNMDRRRSAVGDTPMETRREVVLHLADPRRGARLRRVLPSRRAGATTPACCSPRSRPAPTGSGWAPGCSTSGGAARPASRCWRRRLDEMSGGRFVLGLGRGQPAARRGPARRAVPGARSHGSARWPARCAACSTASGWPRRTGRAQRRCAWPRPRARRADPPRRARARGGAAGRRGRRRLVPVPAAALRAARTASRLLEDGAAAGPDRRRPWSPRACRRRCRPTRRRPGRGRVVGGVLPDQHGPALRGDAARLGFGAAVDAVLAANRRGVQRRTPRRRAGAARRADAPRRRGDRPRRPGALVRRGRRQPVAGAAARAAASTSWTTSSSLRPTGDPVPAVRTSSAHPPRPRPDRTAQCRCRRPPAPPAPRRCAPRPSDSTPPAGPATCDPRRSARTPPSVAPRRRRTAPPGVPLEGAQRVGQHLPADPLDRSAQIAERSRRSPSTTTTIAVHCWRSASRDGQSFDSTLVQHL